MLNYSGVDNLGTSLKRSIDYTTPIRTAFDFYIYSDFTEAGSTPAKQFKLPLEATGDYDFVVDWGDGTIDEITTWNQAETTHTYAVTNFYRIQITGKIVGFSFNNGGDKIKMLRIDNWGPLELGPTGQNFLRCTNLTIIANDAPTLGPGASLASAFSVITNITGNINNWDVSNVQDFSFCFAGTQNFNKEVSAWNMSNATTIRGMFTACTAFNQPVNSWNTSNISGLGFEIVFNNCPSFNQPLNNWNVSQATSLKAVFNNTAFNHPLTTWNVANVTDFTQLFSASSFNEDISSWDTSSAINMASMFQNSVFNQPINTWNTSNVTDMRFMFTNTPFNQSLSSWNVSSVTTMQSMFSNVPAVTPPVFDQDLSSWDISSVSNLSGFMDGQTLSTSNYDPVLIAWDALTVQSSVTASFGNSQYSAGAPATARNSLITNDSWTITDGGQAP